MTAQGAAPATAELRWRLAASFSDKPLLEQISGLLTTQAAIAALSAALQLMRAPRWQAKPPPERSTGEPPFVVAMATGVVVDRYQHRRRGVERHGQGRAGCERAHVFG